MNFIWGDFGNPKAGEIGSLNWVCWWNFFNIAQIIQNLETEILTGTQKMTDDAHKHA